MTAGFLPLVICAAAFVGLHLLMSSGLVRPRLVLAVGEGRFAAIYSIVAGASFSAMIATYAMSPFEVIWTAPAWTAWITVAVMPVAVFLVIVGYTQPNPTAVMQGDALGAPDAAAGVMAITRHPVLWGVALFALAHVPPNGDFASAILFAAVAVLAIGGAFHLDARKRASGGEAWARFESLTSNLPFWGIVTRKTHLSIREIGLWRCLLALAALLVLMWLHPLAIGVTPLPVIE